MLRLFIGTASAAWSVKAIRFKLCPITKGALQAGQGHLEELLHRYYIKIFDRIVGFICGEHHLRFVLDLG
jgi:hypothetical protein